MMIRIWMLWALLTGLLVVVEARAEDERFTLGVYAPSLDFQDGARRNAFATRIARQLSDATEASWSGAAFARRADFESQLRAGEVDLVIVDASYFENKGSSWEAIASGAAQGGATRVSLVIVTRDGGLRRLSELKGKSLVTAETSGGVDALLTNALLEGEVEAGAFFSRIKEVKDTRAARTAVELGKADAVLMLGAYQGGFTKIAELPAAPLPVVAIASERLRESPTASRAREVMTSLSVSGAEPLARFKGHDAGALRAYRQALRRAREANSPMLRPPPPFQAPSLPPIALPDRELTLSATPSDDLLLLPPLPDATAAPERRP